MGRKKRKTVVETPPGGDDQHVAQPTEVSVSRLTPAVVEPDKASNETQQPASSGYAMTSHSGEIVEEDIYVSEGSEDEQEEEAEVMLAGSRMGLMRRGLHHPLLVQPKRQWVRDDGKNTSKDSEGVGEEGEGGRHDEEEDLAKLDPAQRAARLLQEKQRKLEEAKVNARRVESEENAGRDPCLFSKRTAFDIRMDQIEDKPWIRGAGDLTDFFNYSLGEQDWMEYAQQQIAIRNELTEASRQRRAPDPTLVPVDPRTPSKQSPKVAVSGSTDKTGTIDGVSNDLDEPIIGPAKPSGEQGGARTKGEKQSSMENDGTTEIKHVGSGGAWGAGAAPGSVLAKLIEEQEKQQENKLSKKEDKTEYESSRGEDAGSSWNRSGKDNEYYGGNTGGSRYPERYDNTTSNYPPRRGAYHGSGYGGQFNSGGQYNGSGQYNSGGQYSNNGQYYGHRGRGGRWGDRSGGYQDYSSRKRPREDYGNRRW